MRYVFLLILTIFFTVSAWANVSLEGLLNKVTLQLNTEQWVTTKSALVNVGVHAAVSGQGIEKIQNEVIQKLTQLSTNGEWHIVSFDRQLDKSGLESIQIVAQARLPQSDLANLRDKAKSISKPGETFTIDNVVFTPSEEEFRQANVILRNNIYQQAKNEIDLLNKLYPDQKYYLHRIDFLYPPSIQPMAFSQNDVHAARAAGAPLSSSLSVGNKVEVNATAVLASIPETLSSTLTHHQP